MTIPLEIIDLSKTYDTKEAVRNISFKVNENEIIGILGPNGCGKTTTIAMILGLLKPTKGKVLINGIEIEKQRVDLLNDLNFISPYIELPKKLTVKQNLEVYGRLYDVKELGIKIDYLSEKLRLNEFINKITGELSSGQKNRVSLAKSIINDPSVLLLDEPSAGLSPALQVDVFENVTSINKTGVSIVMVEQNATRCLKISDRGYVLDQGKNAYDGTGEGLLHDPNVIKLYLGTMAESR